MARLPPVDVTHCDISALLREMQALRAEVHSFNSDNKVLKDKVAALRAQVVELKAIHEFPLLPGTGDTSTSKLQSVAGHCRVDQMSL